MYREPITEEMAKVAAKWWRNAVAEGEWDNGDAFHNAFFSIMGSGLRENNPEILDRFEKELSELILEEQPFDLSVDYHPDQILYNAAERAGFKSIDFAFPCKSHMAFRNGCVTAKIGYGAEHKYIYGLENAQKKWDDDHYRWVNDQEFRNQYLGEAEYYSKYREMNPEESFVKLFSQRPR